MEIGRADRRLICDECGCAYRGERGWRGYLTREPREVAVFCPACAEREFGDAPPASSGYSLRKREPSRRPKKL
jgi:hypothetical protein